MRENNMDFLIGNSNFFDLKSMAFEVILAVVIGIVINFVYRKTYKGVAFSRNFANTITGLTVVSYFIIRCVTNNTLISLGMVGALSIVRFRNSVKDSSDIMFAFWAIAQGIIIGAEEYLLAIFFVITMSIIIFILFGIDKKSSKKMMLVVKHNSELNIKEFEKLLKEKFSKFYIKEQKVSDENELILEVKYKNKEIINLEEMKVKGIIEISMIDYMEPFI
jgi:hypothetical protein